MSRHKYPDIPHNFVRTPVITVIRTVTLRTPRDHFDTLTLNVIEVIAEEIGGCLVQISAANDDFIEGQCHCIHEMWFSDSFNEQSGEEAVKYFEKKLLEIELENRPEAGRTRA